MRRKLRQRQIPSFGRRMVRVCRETDFSGCCFARKYDCMGMPGKASLCHPCRQPSAPVCGVPRRRNGSRAQRRQRQVRRECRNEDFSGCCFARKYDGMGTSEKSLPLSKAGSEGMSKRGFLRLLFRPEIRRHGDVGKKPPFVKGRFGGNVETRISPAVVSPGNTTAWGRRKKASLCQREVWRECRNEDFSGCYFARKYNCMGTPKKKPPFVKGRFGGNVETRISPAVTSPGNTTAWGRRRNPTARGSCSPRSGGKAP